MFRVSGLGVWLLGVCSGFRATSVPRKRGFSFKISYLHLFQGHNVTLGNLRLENASLAYGPIICPIKAFKPNYGPIVRIQQIGKGPCFGSKVRTSERLEVYGLGLQRVRGHCSNRFAFQLHLKDAASICSPKQRQQIFLLQGQCWFQGQMPPGND